MAEIEPPTQEPERLSDYLADVEQLPMPDLRARREKCVEAETELSYARRLAQARIDMIAAESERRARGQAEPSPDALVEQLPHILGDRSRSPGPGRLPSLLAPSSGTQDHSRLVAKVEHVLPSDKLGSLGTLRPEELATLLDQVSSVEREISAKRHALHDVIDHLQEELVRRYRTGEATVDALLR